MSIHTVKNFLHNCCSYLLSKLCSYNLLVDDQVTRMVLERISVERSEQFNISRGFSHEIFREA